MTCYQPGRSKTLSGGVAMGFTFSLRMVGTKILVPRSWYQDLWGNRSLHDWGTALSANRNRYPFITVRTPQASLVGEFLGDTRENKEYLFAHQVWIAAGAAYLPKKENRRTNPKMLHLFGPWGIDRYNTNKTSEGFVICFSYSLGPCQQFGHGEFSFSNF